MRRWIGVAASAVFGVGLASAALVSRAKSAPAAALTEPSSVRPSSPLTGSLPSSPLHVASDPPTPAVTESEFSRLAPLHFSSANLRQSAAVRLYDAAGQFDEAEAQKLDALLADARDPDQIEVHAIERRTLQLIAKAAYHFRSRGVEVISAYRKPGRRHEGPHGRGAAVDFKLEGVPAKTLAQYLRTQPRVGVGIYTHPRTQYVHLDVREHSFHWLDASPPGKRWRERSIGGRRVTARDASYVRADDWPEGTTPPRQ